MCIRDRSGRAITLSSVMARPLSGLNALKDEMGKRFEALGLVPPRA